MSRNNLLDNLVITDFVLIEKGPRDLKYFLTYCMQISECYRLETKQNSSKLFNLLEGIRMAVKSEGEDPQKNNLAQN